MSFKQLAAGLATALAVSALAQAQPYPNRPVRMIVAVGSDKAAPAPMPRPPGLLQVLLPIA